MHYSICRNNDSWLQMSTQCLLSLWLVTGCSYVETPPPLYVATPTLQCLSISVHASSQHTQPTRTKPSCYIEGMTDDNFARLPQATCVPKQLPCQLLFHPMKHLCQPFWPSNGVEDEVCPFLLRQLFEADQVLCIQVRFGRFGLPCSCSFTAAANLAHRWCCPACILCSPLTQPSRPGLQATGSSTRGARDSTSSAPAMLLSRSRSS